MWVHHINKFKANKNTKCNELQYFMLFNIFMTFALEIDFNETEYS